MICECPIGFWNSRPTQTTVEEFTSGQLTDSFDHSQHNTPVKECLQQPVDKIFAGNRVSRNSISAPHHNESIKTLLMGLPVIKQRNLSSAAIVSKQTLNTPKDRVTSPKLPRTLKRVSNSISRDDSFTIKELRRARLASV